MLEACQLLRIFLTSDFAQISSHTDTRQVRFELPLKCPHLQAQPHSELPGVRTPTYGWGCGTFQPTNFGHLIQRPVLSTCSAPGPVQMLGAQKGTQMQNSKSPSWMLEDRMTESKWHAEYP